MKDNMDGTKSTIRSSNHRLKNNTGWTDSSLRWAYSEYATHPSHQVDAWMSGGLSVIYIACISSITGCTIKIN